MESIYNDLATTILTNAAERKSKRYIIAIAGGPGSGKTTVANNVVRRINASQQNGQKQSQLAVCVSMDGFHLPRASLDALPNREEAYIRRGAPWTFNVDGIVQFVENLKKWAASTPLLIPADGQSMVAEDHFPAPTFSHTLKDPVPNSLLIPPSATIIILEGNYLLLDQPCWRNIAPQMDFRVLIRVDPDKMRERVARRHVRAGIEPNIESGFRRVDGNDAINGRMVEEMVVRGVDMEIESVEDGGEDMDG
ncbi:hypothetical protein FQN54_008820 [Arachnomyces sp. PD_36]|nr:hypothetical protein FQN54_008820 [Arachnomyces sp. PD_36]